MYVLKSIRLGTYRLISIPYLLLLPLFQMSTHIFNMNLDNIHKPCLAAVRKPLIHEFTHIIRLVTGLTNLFQDIIMTHPKSII